MACNHEQTEPSGSSDQNEAKALPRYVVEDKRFNVEGVRVDSPTAFAFVARADGADLVWAPPPGGPLLKRLRLSRQGRSLGAAEDVVHFLARFGGV